MDTCPKCQGTGAMAGTFPTRCSRCGGSGEVQEVQRSIFGTIMTAHPCPTCEGTGQEIRDPCDVCDGDGRTGRRQSVSVEIPAGVTDGLELRIGGAGHGGRQGGPPGDLYVSLHVTPHAVFERRGQDLFAVLEVPVTQATLGADLQVDTLDGRERVRVAPGTQSGEVFRLRGHGVPNLGRRGRGDLFITVRVQTPQGLRREERQLLERLAEIRGETTQKGEPGRLRRPEE
jgi:molecular chaperone DnaJ